ncbi:MAG: LCP family protein [Corynebacterium sp.]|nr:LCP family protein [Corynebacterium sp.]
MSPSPRNNRDIQAAPKAGPDTTQRGSKLSKILLSTLAVASLAFSAAGYYTVGRVGNTVASAGNLTLGGANNETAADGAIDILLVGSDSRTDAQGNELTAEEVALLNAGDDGGNDNTDTIMVMRVPNDGSSATAVSIPRDTYIHDEEFGNTKINGVYGMYKAQRREELIDEGVSDPSELEQKSTDAGRQGLINAVKDLTGIEVDHYAEIGLLGFVLLTDAVGGVDVCLNEDVYDEYSGANFHAGNQTLNGAEALAFVRQRHGLQRGDLDRIVRQQAFMASLVNKVLSTGTLTNPARLNDLASAAERSMIIDEGWDIMSFANQIQGLAGGNVVFNTIPVTSADGVGDYGESIVTVNVSQVHEFFEDMLSDSETAKTEQKESASSDASTVDSHDAYADAELTVLNAGSTAGLAASVADHLENMGFTIAEVGNPTADLYSSSAVLAADTDDEAAKALAEELNVPIEYSSSLGENSYVVVLADDYDGPGSDDSDSSETNTTNTDDEDTVGEPGTIVDESLTDREITAADNDSSRCVN